MTGDPRKSLEDQLTSLKGQIVTTTEGLVSMPESTLPLEDGNVPKTVEQKGGPSHPEGGVLAEDLHGSAYSSNDEMEFFVPTQKKRRGRTEDDQGDRLSQSEKRNRHPRGQKASLLVSPEGGALSQAGTEISSDEQIEENKEVREDFTQTLAAWSQEVEGLIRGVRSPRDYARLRNGMLRLPSSGEGGDRYYLNWKHFRNALGRKITEEELKMVHVKNQELDLLGRKKFQELVQEDLLMQEQSLEPIRSPWEEKDVWKELSDLERKDVVRIYQQRIEHQHKMREKLERKKTPQTPRKQIHPSDQEGVKIPAGMLTLGKSTEVVTDSAHDEEAKRIQFGNVGDGVTPHPYQTRNDTAYEKVIEVARRELYATERTAGKLAPKEEDGVQEQGPSLVAEGLSENKQGEQVAEIKEGDIWERKVEQGARTILETITVEGIEGSKVVIRRAVNGNVFSVENEELARLMEELRQDNYRNKKEEVGSVLGSVSELQPQKSDPVGDSVTLEQLLTEIPDGAEFVLISKTGKTKEKYHRQGDEFLSARDGVVTDNVLARLQKGWALEMSAPEVPKEENKDLLKGRDPKDYSKVLPGDVWVLRTANGQVLNKLTVNFLQRGQDVGEIIQASSSWEKSTDETKEATGFYPVGLEWRKGEFAEKLQNEGYVLEVAGEVPKTQSQKKETIDHQKESEPYARINSGDVWELRSPAGEKLERVEVETVFEKKKKGEMWVEVEIEYDKTASIAEGKKQEQWQSFPLETFRRRLQEGGYVLIARGNGAELEFGGYFDKKELEKKEEDILGLPKKEDEWVRYITDKGEVGVSYDSVSKFYTITSIENGGTIGVYSEGNIRRLAALEGWKKIGEGQEEPARVEPTEPNQPEPVSKAREMALPQGDEEVYYRAENGREFKIRKDLLQEGVYILVALSTLQEREVSEAEFRELAEKNKWEEIEKGSEALVGPEPFNDQLIEKARAVVEETRGDFVRVETEQNVGMERLKKYFPFLHKEGEINSEVRDCWLRYENALIALQSLEIERIKRSGLKDKELKQSIAGMIREYDFEEAERIDNAKRTVRLKEEKPLLEKVKMLWESTLYNKFDGGNLGGKKWRDLAGVMIGGTAIAGEALYRGARATGEAYNKVVSTKGGKVTMMAAGGVAFGTAVLFSGGAAASMAGIMLAAKKAAAGAGFAIAAEGFADKGAKVLRSRKANKKTEEFFDKVLDERIEARMQYGEAGINPDADQDLLARLETYLKGEVNKEAYGKSVKRERNQLYRKTGAVMAGVLFGSSSFVHNIFSEAQAATPGGSGGGMEKVAEAIEGEIREMSRESLAIPSEAVSASLEQTNNGDGSISLLQERVVASGDTIGKYMMESSKELGLDSEEEQRRFAALVREKINEKLATTDPGLAKTAGFVPNKDGVLTADFIRAGEKVDLGRILSGAEMKALAEQTNGEIRVSTTPSVESLVTPSSTVLEQTEAVLKEAGVTVPPTSEVAPTETPSVSDAMAEFGLGKNTVTEYIKALPQAEQVEVFRTMRSTMRNLFNTPEISIYGNYDMNYDLKEHPELSKALMTQVLEDHKTLSSRAFYMYDRKLNPLHWTQMQELAKFSEGATKTLGKELAAPLKRESIEEYILRVALVAKQSGKSFPGLNVVK